MSGHTSSSRLRRRSSILGLAARSMLQVRPIYNLLNLFTAVRFVVRGDSMQPTFAGDQYILVSRMAYLAGQPGRGDVVVLRHPGNTSREYIKRIIGLPGDRVQCNGGQILINGRLIKEPHLKGQGHYRIEHGDGDQPPWSPMGASYSPESSPKDWSLGDDQYFVMGDNRANSDDSRSFGPVSRDLIVGKAWVRYWPRSAWGIIR